MTFPFFLRSMVTVAFASIACSIHVAIEPVPVSLRSTVVQAIGKTTVTIDYSRPNAKGRDVFCALVPYGAVWRTGANEATTMAFTTGVALGGTEIPAGRYALFTIPRAEAWTIIVNTVADQFGAFSYDASKDLLRFDVPVRPLPSWYRPRKGGRLV